MHNSQLRNIRTTKKKNQGNVTPSKGHNSSITEFKNIEKVEMPNKEYKNLVLKMVNKLKEDSNKQMNEI
jgi:hypothetical protein